MVHSVSNEQHALVTTVASVFGGHTRHHLHEVHASFPLPPPCTFLDPYLTQLVSYLSVCVLAFPEFLRRLWSRVTGPSPTMLSYLTIHHRVILSYYDNTVT